MKHLLVALLFAAAVIGGCQKKKGPAWKDHTFQERDLTRALTEPRLPRSLWEKITGMLTKTMADGHQTKARGPLPSVFTPIKVYLVEKNRGVLSGGHTEILYGPGGGELDLKDFMGAKNGSFYLAVEFMPEVENVERRIFHLSNSVVRTVGKETLGSGCNTYFEVSKGFEKAMQKDGLLLNSTDKRHLSALAGTLFFAANHEGKLHLAALTVKDSSASPKMVCHD